VILEGVTSVAFSEPAGDYSHLPAALHIQEQHRVSQNWLSLIQNRILFQIKKASLSDHAACVSTQQPVTETRNRYAMEASQMQ